MTKEEIRRYLSGHGANQDLLDKLETITNFAGFEEYYQMAYKSFSRNSKVHKRAFAIIVNESFEIISQVMIHKGEIKDTLENSDLPKFVGFKEEGLSFRLKDNRYYRDYGDWYLDVKVIDGELYAHYPSMSLWHNQLLVPTSEFHYREDNAEFTPTRNWPLVIPEREDDF